MLSWKQSTVVYKKDESDVMSEHLLVTKNIYIQQKSGSIFVYSVFLLCVAGGVVATDMSTTQQNMTPLLLMVGERDNFFAPEKAREAARNYGANVTAIHVAPGKGRQMISSPAEMQQIMKFVSGRLLKSSPTCQCSQATVY